GIRDFHVTGVQTCALPISPRPRRVDRGTSRRVQHARPGLGPSSVRPPSLAARRLSAVRRDAPGTDGPRRGAADRPRDGAVPPVLDPRRRASDPRGLCPLPARRAARHLRPGEHPGPGRGGGRGSGTVEPGVREELAARHVLSYRLLWFEDRPPEEWPELSMASVTTHDLPTVAGLWTGADLAEQQHYDMAPNAESTQAIRRRAARLGGVDPDAPVDEVTERLHRRLAAAPSRLITATLEDAARAVRRPNIPGASRRPNWCIPLPLLLEELIEDPIANT